MNCPKCHADMQIRTIGDVQIEECAKCNGVWFDEDELRKAKDRADSDLQWMDFELWKHADEFRVSSKPVQCPKCNVKMAAIEYGETNVEIDHCVKCKGVWLDGGEFEKIIKALTDELETKSALEYLKESLEEAIELVTGPESFVSEWKDLLTVIRMLEYRILVENPRLNDELVKIQRNLPPV